MRLPNSLNLVYIYIYIYTSIYILSFLLPGVDLALLSLSHHSIITYGTFSMWGAFFSSKGEVIMPKDHENTDVGENIKKANIPNWKFI